MAELLVSRICGLPAAVLDGLRAPETLALLEEAEAAAARKNALREPVCDLLHAVIGRDELSRAQRRALIRLRRGVFNDRTDEAGLRLSREVLAPADAERLGEWHQALVRERELLEKAARALTGELAAAQHAVSAALRQPDVLAGLALASPEFVTAFTDRPELGKPSGRLSRSAVSYLVRTTLKPSPFGTLTTVGVGDFAGAVEPGPERRLVSSSRVAARLAYAALASDPVVLPNVDTRLAGDEWLAALPIHLKRGGVYFREDEVTALPGPVPFDARPRRLRELAALLGCSTDELHRLVDQGLLLLVPPWQLTEPRHFTAWGEPALAEAEKVVAGNGNGRERADAVLALRSRLRATMAEHDPARAGWLDGLGLVHETVAHGPEPETAPPAWVPGELDRLEGVLRSMVRPRAGYFDLVRFFVHHYRDGSADLAEFAFRAVRELDPMWWLSRCAVPDPQLREVSGASVGRPVHSVFWQVAGDSLVLNQVHPGYLGAIARWASVPGLSDQVETAMTALHERRFPDAVVYQLTAHADWTDTQRPAVRATPCLAWGAERAYGGVPIDGFRVRHDPATGTLEVLDPAGRPAALSYLGAVPAHLLRGIPRVLQLLSDPWLSLGSWTPTPGPGFRDRMTDGRLVLRRARWTLPASALPPLGNGPDLDFLRAGRMFRAEHGLPEQLFVRGLAAGGTPLGKPQWLSFDRPLAAWTALKGLAGAEELEFTEALPAAGAAPGRVTEFLTVVTHD
ncbi:MULTISPECIES: lantibiotic dehydratase [Actinomycetes]|uniref:lantibiotic dehydratase n=1 Tax=Actinomycetes TaxID=1760 RepID=UPI0002D5F88A|nr:MULTISPECIES: lantibiotic dehydratase [Actinomycetes]